MNYAQFVSLPDLEKRILVEAKPAYPLEEEVWTSLNPPIDWLCGWKRRKQLSVKKTHINSNLPNFPTFVKFVDDPNIGAHARADGFDVRFTKSNGTEVIPYDRLIFSKNGSLATGKYYTKRDLLSEQNTVIWVYYDKQGAADGNDPANVWDANCMGIWHGTDKTTQSFEGSTSDKHLATKTGANEPLEVDGKLHKAQRFDGSNDFASVPNHADFKITNAITISCWWKGDKSASYGAIIRRDVVGSETEEYSLAYNNAVGIIRFNIYTASGRTFVDTGDISGSYHWITATYDKSLGSNRVKIYIDNVLIAQENGFNESMATPDSELWIGKYLAGAFIDGNLEELRVSNIDRGADWDCFAFYNMSSADNELIWGEEEVYNNAFYTEFKEGEIVGVGIDGNELTEVYSPDDCNETPSSFFYDLKLQRLYVNTGEDDSPGAKVDSQYKYCALAYFWVGFTDHQSQNNPAIYQRQDELIEDGNLDLWFSGALKYWSKEETGSSTVSKDSSNVYDKNSAYSAKISIDASSNLARFYQEIKSTKPRTKHKVKLKYKMADGSSAASLRVYDKDSNVFLNSNGKWLSTPTDISLANSTSWQEFSLEFLTHKNYSNYYIELRSVIANSVINFDYVELKRFRAPMYYLPYLPDKSIPSVRQSVGDYYIGDEQIQYGSLKYINDGWWYKKKAKKYNFNNKDLKIKFGKFDFNYEDFETIFTGICRKPSIEDAQVIMELKDTRISKFRSIPRKRYSTDDYPNMESNLEDTAIRVLMGKKTNISPPCIDTITFKYKISQTIFNSTTYAMESIDAVKKDGNTLTPGTDYTVDLDNGEFTLLADPGDSKITCDAKGIKIDFEDGSYSDLAADICFFVLTVLNPIKDTEINIASILDLKSKRTQKMGIYLGEINTVDFLIKLKKSAIFHILPFLSGEYVTKCYVIDVEEDTPRFKDEDYAKFRILEETDKAFKEVAVKYDEDPTTGEWKTTFKEENKTDWCHNVKDILTVDTYLINKSEAEALRDFFIKLISDPADQLEAKLTSRALNINPTDKGIFSKKVKTIEDEEIEVIAEKVYRILELNKNPSSNEVDILALKDMQSVGYGFHADEPHQDIHEDLYLDLHQDGAHGDEHQDGAHGDSYNDGHQDTPHSDSHTDTYSDEPHQDEAHVDSPHIDAHQDEPYEDSHGDIIHEDYHMDGHDDTYYDEPHQDLPHQDHMDGIYEDEEYTDILHIDDYLDDHSDYHIDSPHIDTHEDEEYIDNHQDVAHEDIEHSDYHVDSYQDVPHVDIPYEDAHADSYEDSEHIDSHIDEGHQDYHSDEYTDTHEDQMHSDSYI